MSRATETYDRIFADPQPGTATRAAFDALTLQETVMADPRYAELERKVGPLAARMAVTEYGATVLADYHGGTRPNITPSDNTLTTGRMVVYNAMLGMTNNLGPGEVQQLADRVFDSLNQQQRLEVATLGLGSSTANLIVGDAATKVAPDAIRHPATVTGPVTDAATSFFTADAFGRIAGLSAGSQSGGSNYSSLAAYNAQANLNSITSQNFGMTNYAAAGLNYEAFSDLRRQGFSSTQIMGAANLSRELGINVSQNAAAVARLQRDVPNIDNTMRDIHSMWRNVRSLEELERRARATGDTEAAENYRKMVEEARKRAEEAQRNGAQTVPPARQQDYWQIIQNLQRGADSHFQAVTSDPSERARISDILTSYHQNPNDPTITAAYERMMERYRDQPTAVAAIRAVEENARRLEEVRTTLHVDSETRLTNTETILSGTDTAVLALNDLLATDTPSALPTGDQPRQANAEDALTPATTAVANDTQQPSEGATPPVQTAEAVQSVNKEEKPAVQTAAVAPRFRSPSMSA